MCICDIEIGERKYICDGDFNSLCIRREIFCYYIEAKGDGSAEIKINYCPMCGRTLED